MTLVSTPIMGVDGRRARLFQLAAEWGVHNLPPVAPPTPAPQPRTPDHDFHAEELLKRRRISSGQDRQSQGSIKRAFSSNRKSWEPAEVFAALDAHVANAGAPAVADALVAKLLSAGGDPNLSGAKAKTNLLTRRRSVESMQRSRVLHKAIENRQPDMVAVLVRHADPLTLDAALPLALRAGDPAIVSLLLGRGANASQTQDAQDAFRQMCIVGGYAELIGLVLQSDGRPPPAWLSMCMVDAARKGCLPTVLRLSRAAADGEFNRAEALRTAISQCRVDVALAVLTGTKPPATGGQGVLESFALLLDHATVGPNEKMALTEALLCAGAAGDSVSAALARACATEFYDMITLLVAYGASVENQDAAIVRDAIARGKTNLVQLLLVEPAALSPVHASECLRSVPREIPPEDRHAIFTLLLRKGAGGPPLHDALIDAVQAGDAQSVQLLLTPNFPRAQPTAQHGSPAVVRHEVASVDHRGGLALRTAVRAGSLPMVKLLLSGKPATPTLDHVFPAVLGMPPAARYHAAECFLAAGVSRECVSAALQHAIGEQPPRRDERLISMLLRHNADVNFNDGAGVLSAVTIRDLPLLETLLRSKPSPQTMAAAMTRAMAADDRPLRYSMVRLLIAAGAGREGTEVSEALVRLLSAKPPDTQLAALLLEQGRADANFDQGLPVAMAVADPDPAVLELVLRHGRPAPDTLYRGLDALASSAATPSRLQKAESLLRRGPDKEILHALLFKEVQTLLTTAAHRQTPTTSFPDPLAVLRALLTAGADPNAHKAAALTCAIKAADGPIVDLFFAPPATAPHRLTPPALAAALPHSLNIPDPMDRLAFTHRLLANGAPPAEAARALLYALSAHPRDVPLVSLLAEHAATVFTTGRGEAGRDVLVAAVRGGSAEVVTIVAAKGREAYTREAVGTALLEGMKVADRESRVGICRALLGAGVDGPAVSDALVVAAGEGDLALATVLLEGGASVEHREGQAVIEACRAGDAEVVGVLLGGKGEVSRETLARAFGAAAQVADLVKRAGVFRLLLERGVSGEAVDAQLVAAAKFGDGGEALVRLLLEFGASVDYNAGEAIWNATRGAVMGSLRLLLGVERAGEAQKQPTRATLLRALKASRKLGRDARYQAIDWLFQAGLPPCEEIDIALNRAVKEDPDPRLVQLLLKHGASPLANGCETLADAAQLLLVDILGLLLEVDVPKKDVSWAFQQAFTPATAASWLSEKGFQAAEMLLEKGAEGESLALALGTAIDAYGSENDAIARTFTAALLRSGVDVNHQGGLVLQEAARKADSELVQQILHRRPDSHAVSMAFPCIFDADLSEAETIALMELFTDYHDGEERLDVMFAHPDSEPAVIRVLDKFPRSARVLQTLLDAGYYHDQAVKIQVLDDTEPEDATLLLWALAQPQKRVSSAVIELLVDRGAKVNFETALSKTTPLMLAIRSRRHDVVKTLVLAGAEVDVVDATGNTPMTLVTQIGGELSTAMMSTILAADPSTNDGSLHNAARDLNLRVMRVLVEHGHDVDFPSTLHGGRSALGELCLHAARAGPLTAAQEKQMEKAMAFLLSQDSDLTIQSDGKSVLLLALHSADPVPTARALLKVGLWKHVNKPYNHFTDGAHTYSATQYVARLLPCDEDVRSQLLALLRANRAVDVYYANDGPQPPDAVNLPAELLRAERERRAREERIAREGEEHALALARTREMAEVQNQLLAARAELEDARARRRRDDEAAAARDREAADEASFAAELRRRKAAREAAVEHEQRVTEAGLTRARLVAEAELELEGKKRDMMVQWERDLARQRESDARALSAVRLREREAVERLDAAADARTVKRIAEQKKLVDGQTALATRLASGPGGVDRRQIGFVTGELD